jgi:hypothetical protein
VGASRSVEHRIRWAARIAFAVLAVAVAVAMQVSESTAAADRLPDLGMAPVSDIKIDQGGGRRLLRFSTTIVDVGAGAFELRATRPSSSGTWSATQRIYDDAGGFRSVPVATSLVFGGDGHSHWHIRDLVSMELIRLDNGVKVGTSTKRGFCFWDNRSYRLSLPRAPASPVYTSSSGCGTTSSTSVVMGLSVGWGDIYPSTLPDQYIDITGLTAGRYRLRVTADALGQFTESNEANNQTWVDLQLNARGKPKVVGWGPAA